MLLSRQQQQITVARELFQDGGGKTKAPKPATRNTVRLFAETGLLFGPQKPAFSKKKKAITGFGVSYWPKIQRSLKKKAYTGLSVFLTQNQQNKVFAGAFFVPNMARDKSLKRAKISPGRAAALLLPAPMAN